MLTLEVLQIFPSQRDALLASIDSMESVSLMAKFNLSDVKPHFPYHVPISIYVVHGEKTIGKMVIDEGASTCLISISC